MEFEFYNIARKTSPENKICSSRSKKKWKLKKLQKVFSS